MRSFLAAILILFAGTASAVTIDFEELPNYGLFPFQETVVSQGFLFNDAVNLDSKLAVFNENIPVGMLGNRAIGALPDQDLGIAKIGIGTVDGSEFSLISFVMDELLAADSTVFACFYSCGFEFLAETSTFSIANLSSQAVGASESGLREYYLPGNWIGIEYATIEYYPSISSSALVVDNIVVSAVPIPAAVWLFGSALAGLGWMRRKQTI